MSIRAVVAAAVITGLVLGIAEAQRPHSAPAPDVRRTATSHR